MDSSTQKPGERIALGFDIGGSKTKLGLVSERGQVIVQHSFPTALNERPLEDFIQHLLRELHAMLERGGGQVVGIGMTFAGWIDEDRRGPFLCFNLPQLRGYDLRGLIEREFGLPTAIYDDVNAHTLAEYTFGSGRGYRRFMCLAMGTGLSAGVMLDGELLRFTGGCIGDAGHLILRPGGPRCTSGCRGCGEALIGVAGIERLGMERYGEHREAHEIIRLAREGSDPVASKIMGQVGVYMGELLASLSHLFLPERIALTGGTARAGNVLLEAARGRFEDLVGDYHRLFAACAEGYYNGVDIVLGSLEGETGVIGSVVDLFRV